METNHTSLGPTILNKQEALELIRYGLPANTADFILIEEPGNNLKVKYIDLDLGMKNFLGSTEFQEDSPFIPTWSTGRLITLYVLGFSTDFYSGYDREFDLKTQIYEEILEGLKSPGSRDFTPENLNHKLLLKL